MLIDFNDTTDDLPPPNEEKYVPHPNYDFDAQVGQEFISNSPTDTRANLLGHMGDLGVVQIN
jgi:hypothetical protein